MTLGLRYYWFMKKTKGQKSHASVPLKVGCYLIHLRHVCAGEWPDDRLSAPGVLRLGVMRQTPCPSDLSSQVTLSLCQEWVSDWVIDCWMNGLVGWLFTLLIDWWLIDWLNWSIDLLIDLLVDLLPIGYINWLLVAWLLHWLVNGLIAWHHYIMGYIF